MKNLIQFPYLKILLMVLLVGCDTLQSDDVSPAKSVTISDAKQYVLSGEVGVIDLQSRIKSTQPIDFRIESQPANGQLTTLRAGLLQYTPNKNFQDGRDAFVFSVYSKSNTFIKKDSIILIVSSDSTSLPCGLYAKTDYVSAVDSVTDINVLGNDMVCQDISKVRVSIVSFIGAGSDTTSSTPYFGKVEVLASNEIRYTPNANYTGGDKFRYKITNINDTTQFSYGAVYITSKPPCELTLTDDVVTLNALKDSTINIMILANDVVCTGLNSGSGILVDGNPMHGTGYLVENYIKYKLTNVPLTNSTDTLSYMICADEVCRRAKVTINIKVQ